MMRKPVIWMGAAGGIALGACSRVVELAFGKALAFTYAVIVSLVANVAIDFVREPAHTLPPGPVAGEAAYASLPAAHAASTAPAAPVEMPPASAPLVSAPQPASGQPGGAQPGPGSGGLY